MTKWLLALGILAASAVHAHAAVGVALPLPVFLIVFAIFIVLLVLLLAIGGMSHFGAWWSKRGLPAKALTAALLVLVLAGLWQPGFTVTPSPTSGTGSPPCGPTGWIILIGMCSPPNANVR